MPSRLEIATGAIVEHRLRMALTQLKHVLRLSERDPKPDRSAAGRPRSAHASANDACDFCQDTLTEGQNLDIGHLVLPNLLGRGFDLGRGRRALHEDKLTAIPEEGRGQRKELAEGADGTSRHLVERIIDPRVLGARPEDRHIVETQLRDLLIQPGDSTLHRLDQDERHVRPGNGEHQPRQSGPASDIPNSPRPKQGSDDRAVQDVTRPQAGEFQGSDETAFLTLLREVVRELAGEVDAVAEEDGRRLGFVLDVGHSFT